jgi:threonyl-tRNA synthetase
LGSLERFMGVLVEHYGGAFPVWLAPVQGAVIPVSEKHHAYATHVEETLKRQGLRVEADLRNEKVGYKIRDSQMKKIAYMLIVGDREVGSETVSVRNRFEGDQGAMPVPQFAEMVQDLIERKEARP